MAMIMASSLLMMLTISCPLYVITSVKQILLSSAQKGRPITCVVYTLLLPWVPDVARQFHVPSALL